MDTPIFKNLKISGNDSNCSQIFDSRGVNF